MLLTGTSTLAQTFDRETSNSNPTLHMQHRSPNYFTNLIRNFICSEHWTTPQEVCEAFGHEHQHCYEMVEAIERAEFCEPESYDDYLIFKRMKRNSENRSNRLNNKRTKRSTSLSNITKKSLQVKSRQKRNMQDSSWSASMIASIDRYGCWCYFGSDIRFGRATPINTVDMKCKYMIEGYYCMKRDHEDGDTGGSESCTPTHTVYQSATGFAMYAAGDTSKEQAIWDACQKLNGGGSNCESRACAVEGYFLLNIFDLFLSGDSLDPMMKHSMGFFDPDVSCTISSFPGTCSNKECCGEYPLRMEHRICPGENKSCCSFHMLDNDVKDCCDSTDTYNYFARSYMNDVKTCCDNEVKAIGSC